MSDAWIVSAVRTAVGRATRGTLKDIRPDEMAAVAIRDSIRRVDGLRDGAIEDVVLGCAMPEGEQGMNVARIASLRAGLPFSASAMTINRFCSSGLQSIALAAERIMAGSAQVIVAGGTESMSHVPIGGHRFVPNPWIMKNSPDWYLPMGLTAERLAVRYGISRAEADDFSYRSHMKALAAAREGRFRDEIVPLTVRVPDPEGGSRDVLFDADEGPRPDTTQAALAGLKPAFDERGQVTAGNSSQMSDGAAAAVVMSSERAAGLGVRPLARFLSFATAGVPPELMGIGPVEAIPKALELAGLELGQIDLIELNEAFAVQALAVIRLAGLDPDRVNVNGGAIALGHPLGATGAKLTATLLYEMRRRGSRYGMVTMCVGGGMGAAGIFERL